MRQLTFWTGLNLVLGSAMVWMGRGMHQGAVEVHQEQGATLVIAGGVVLLLLAASSLALRFRLGSWLAAREPRSAIPATTAGSPPSARPYITLFVVSFVVLFVEVMLIRYCSSQIRIFSFYKNIPLVSAFLGLGLGCWQGRGGSKEALRFLFWLLPLSVFLSQGALALDEYLGRWAAAGSSEQILGDEVVPVVERSQELISQLSMGVFCVVMLVAITLLFALLGRLLGESFEHVPRIPGYTVNIFGSLVGILGFLGLSYLQTPPWAWFVVGLTPLLWWLRDRRQAVLGALLIAINVAIVAPAIGNTVWSPYQKLVGIEIPAGDGGTGTSSPAYRVEISDVFYQVAVDLSPSTVEEIGHNPFPHYDDAYRRIPGPERVLVVGAGTGNDVAAALRAGAKQVVAVDIDPAIVDMGREFHPEAPYDDPRVELVVDDARRSFRYLETGSFDVVLFGLLDSHSQLGISSLRLDNYVFTLDSFESARRLLRPDGWFVISAATFRDWFARRMAGMLEATCEEPVHVSVHGVWVNYTCQVESSSEDPDDTATAQVTLPTDDWPFLYLPTRGIPAAYLVVLAMLVVGSVAVLRAGGLSFGRFTAYHLHLFFLGAAFLLMEVYAINRLALLFGTTWLVSAITIALILVLIIAANMTVVLMKEIPYLFAYGALAASMLGSFSIDPAIVLGGGLGAAVAYGFIVVLPVYFAGLVFARSFSMAAIAGPAIGANILGSVIGGWVEYGTMLLGIRAMALVALMFYLLSWLGLVRWRTQGGSLDTDATPPSITAS